MLVQYAMYANGRIIVLQSRRVKEENPEVRNGDYVCMFGVFIYSLLHSLVVASESDPSGRQFSTSHGDEREGI